MVNRDVTTAAAAERALLLLHVPARARSALGALLALDDRLRALFAAGRDPRLRQIRLAWWRDALSALDTAPAPPEPILTALAAQTLPLGITGTRLSCAAEGWGEVLGEVDDATLTQFARDTGATMFGAMAKALRADDARLAAAGEGWALTRYVAVAPDVGARARAAALATARLDSVARTRWPRPLRVLAMLSALARSDLAGGIANSPARAALMLRIRAIGR